MENIENINAYTDKKLQILETAERLFSAKGFDGTSVRDIADEAGVNVAMISYYFRSKEKLMESLFEQRMGHIKMRAESLLHDNSLTPFQKMEVLIDDHIERVMHKQKFYRIMFCEQILNKNEVVINIITQLKKRNAAVIGALIAQGQDSGAFRKDIDCIFMMSTLVGTVSQVLINQDYYRDFNQLKEIPDKEFEVMIKKKLTNHIKTLFKAILTYEA